MHSKTFILQFAGSDGHRFEPFETLGKLRGFVRTTKHALRPICIFTVRPRKAPPAKRGRPAKQVEERRNTAVPKPEQKQVPKTTAPTAPPAVKIGRPIKERFDASVRLGTVPVFAAPQNTYAEATPDPEAYQFAKDITINSWIAANAVVLGKDQRFTHRK